MLTAGATPSDQAPTVIALHGLGDNAERFSHLFRDFAHPARFLVVQAPTPYGDGYSWFSIRGSGSDRHDGATIEDAVARLVQFMEYAKARYPSTGKPVITGFSQGGILSFAVAALHPERISACFPIAGTMTDELRALATMRASQLPPIVAFHGAADPVIGVQQTRLAVNALARAGADAELHVYEALGHHISAELKRDYSHLLGLRLSAAPAG